MGVGIAFMKIAKRLGISRETEKMGGRCFAIYLTKLTEREEIVYQSVYSTLRHQTRKKMYLDDLMTIVEKNLELITICMAMVYPILSVSVEVADMGEDSDAGIVVVVIGRSASSVVETAIMHGIVQLLTNISQVEDYVVVLPVMGEILMVKEASGSD
jgi:hypothetical protein